MSFGGGFGGGGGFGSTNNNTQSTGFGGFGSSNTTGFGQQQSSGFGANASSGGNSLFGGGGGSGFGTTASTGTGFGAPKPFGSTTGGGLFGNTASTTANTGFGGGTGFGTTSNTNAGFGTTGSSSALFGGGNKTGFSSGTTTGGGLFGSSNTGGFGSSANNASSGLFGSSQTNQECPGTGTQPFQAHTEKEPNSQVTNHYQSITFMQPYQKWSFEELRLADYNAGRRYGNGSGQAGAFGASTGFGGFGQQNNQSTTSGFGANTGGGGGLFGQQSSSGGFGSTTQTTGGFGTATSGSGLFGQQSKPSGGLFGSTPTTSASTGGGLFGTAGSTGFGGQQQQGSGFSGGTGSLFGNNQTQQKSGFSFGQNNTTSGTGGGFASGGGGFGSTANNTGGGLFGSNQTQNQGGGLFGNNQQQQASGGLFGQQQNQNQTQAQGQGFGGFGQNSQQKPGGLFGNTGGASGGLFGQTQNNQQQPAATGLFGQSNAAGGGLFGQKPAQGGSSLFGQNASNSTSGGLFGNNQSQQQNQGGGLFGGSNNTTGGGLFGQKPAQNSGGLFGNNQQPNQGGSLFGSQNNQNQNAGFSLGGLNNSTGSFGTQQNALQGPPALTASASDANPYGSASIFSGLPQPNNQSPGPVATPITAGQKQKKAAALPQFKINPAMASRFATPQRRGYGFTYSTYGTPSSVSSVASSPGGMGSSLIASSYGRSLGKSVSASNLRRNFDTDGDNILNPGAFSASSNRYGTGSLKKLNIDRSLRTDLFGSQPLAALPAPERTERPQSPSIKKKVSFDTSVTGGNGSASATNGSVQEDDSNPSAQDQGFVRSRSSSGTNGRGLHGSPSKENTQNTELKTVHEDGSPQATSRNALVVREQHDPDPGDYWTKPSLNELKSWPKDRLRAVKNFEVGRINCGRVEFQEPVDLATLDLEHICGKIVVIELRSLTVYPTTVEKPPVGQGLNVPSVIVLENSWPRQRDKKTPLFEKSGPRFDKHVKRLMVVSDTTFIDYDRDNGEWTFRVEHFTTYGYDYDEDDTATEQSDVDAMDTSRLSEATSMATPTPLPQFQNTSEDRSQLDSSLQLEVLPDNSELDDTFDFKRKLVPPGAFDLTLPFGTEQGMDEASHNMESFLGERSAALESEEEEQDEPSSPDLMEMHDSIMIPQPDTQQELADIVGSFPLGEGDNGLLYDDVFDLGHGTATPQKTLLDDDIDWMEQLHRTISPQKHDRHALRQSQALFLKDPSKSFGSKPLLNIGPATEIATSIDLIHSLFGKEETRRMRSENLRSAETKSFKWPYDKSSASDLASLSDTDREFHASFKPNWSKNHHLTYVTYGVPNHQTRDICTMKFEKAKDISAARFQQQKEQTEFVIEQGVPKALPNVTQFAANDSQSKALAAHSHEHLTWELLSILFDDYADEFSSAIPEIARPQFADRIRKDRFSAFWARLCEEEALKAVAAAPTAEERAIAYLSAHRVPEACAALEESGNYRLATLISRIGDDNILQESLQTQISEWRQRKILSEISEPIRTLYELLAGNTCKSIGQTGAAEDIATDFLIPQRFGMDWKRAFGLKLWYGTADDDVLETAVQEFANDLLDTSLPSNGSGKAYGPQPDFRSPLPFFLTDHNISLPWKDPNMDQRKDVLWGLLLLFSGAIDNGSTHDLAEVVMPENVIGLPMFHRLSFELYRAVAPRMKEHASMARGDALTLSFATELEAVDQWLWAIMVSLHLSTATSRRLAVQSILARNAGALHYSKKTVWYTLVDEFKLPEHWLWAAMALYARSNPTISPDVALRYLLKANEVEEAHRILLQTVAPLKIVERDYKSLQNFLSEFDEAKPKAWDRGGGLYADFTRLVESKLNKKERSSLVAKLVRGLADTQDGAIMSDSDESSGAGFLQRVAVREMSHVVGDMLSEDAEGDNGAQAFLLQLPVNPETKASRARDLSWSYYRKVMASGK